MKQQKGIVLLIVIAVVSINLVPMMQSTAKETSKIIYVDDDASSPYDGTHRHPYKTIQEGIDASVDGYTVYVYTGIYFENVVVDKSITLQGENRNTTIINGTLGGHVVKILADNVSIIDFTVCNSSHSYNGIFISSNYNNICDNIISKNLNNGIVLSKSSNNIISRNTITKNIDGITLKNTSNNYLTRNNISNNSFGIYSYYSECDTIYNNTFISNQCTIILRRVSDYNITKNVIINSETEAIDMFGSSRNTISGNTIIDSNGTAIHFGFWCHKNIISENMIKDNNLGIYLHGSFNNTIFGNELKNDEEELYFWGCSNTVVKNNNILQCRRCDVYDVYFWYWTNFPFKSFQAAQSNKFIRNYWGRFRFLPKPIKVDIFYYLSPIKPSKCLHAFIFDWNPAREPYDIKIAT